MEPHLVAETLRRCASADESTRVPATQTLQQLETTHGFCAILLQLYDSSDLDSATRFLAISMASNVVARRWNPRTGMQLSSEEKTHVKEFLIRRLNGLNEIIHLQAFSNFFRKVARVQFPAHWPELCQWWTQRWQRQGGDDEVALETFHNLLKDQRKKIMLADKKAFHEIAPAFLSVLGPTWLKVENISARMRYHLDGCMGILFIYGVPHLRNHPHGLDFVSTFVQRLNGQCADDDFGFRNKKKLVKQFGLLVRHHPLACNESSLFAGLNCVLSLAVQDVDVRLRNQCIETLTHAIQQKAVDAPFQQWVVDNFSLLMTTVQKALRRTPEEVEAILAGEQPETRLRFSTKTFVEALGKNPHSTMLAEALSKEFLSARNSSDPLLFETVLALAAISHSSLKENGLGYGIVMEALVVPATSLFAETGAMGLLPIAACEVLKRWASDAPTDTLPQVAEIVFSLLCKGGSVGLRCASLYVLKEFLPRFMESPNWSALCVQLLPAIFDLIDSLHSLPEEIWKCLSLFVMIFEGTSAEDGDGAADLVAIGLRHLWVKHRESQFIADAILDVLRSLTLLPVTEQLSETMAAVLLDAFGQSSRDIDQARVCLLGAIRTVPQDRCALYRPFVPCVLTDARQQDGREREITTDILIEMAALGLYDAEAVNMLIPLCQQWLEAKVANASGEPDVDAGMQYRALRLLLLLMSSPAGNGAGVLTSTDAIRTVVEALVKHFLLTFNAETAEKYPLPISALVPIVCAFVQAHPPTETDRYIEALGASLRLFRREEAKVAVFQTMMILQPNGGTWFFPSLHEVFLVQSLTPLKQALHKWTSARTRLPKPVRVQHELAKRWNCNTNMDHREVHAWGNRLICSAFGSISGAIECAPNLYKRMLIAKFCSDDRI